MFTFSYHVYHVTTICSHGNQSATKHTRRSGKWSAASSTVSSHGERIFMLFKWPHALYTSETAVQFFWRNYHHWLHWKLSKWQLLVQPLMKMSSRWQHFHFSVFHYAHRSVDSGINIGFIVRILYFQQYVISGVFSKKAALSLKTTFLARWNSRMSSRPRILMSFQKIDTNTAMTFTRWTSSILSMLRCLLSRNLIHSEGLSDWWYYIVEDHYNKWFFDKWNWNEQIPHLV